MNSWLVIAGVLFGGGGIGAAWIGARSLQKVEGIKNTTALFDALAQRQNDALARADRRIEQLEAENARLEAELQRRGRPE